MGWPLPTHDSFRARMERVMHPGSGSCLRCGMPWGKVEPHSTQYTIESGCFPLCQGCWELLGCPEARIEYYAKLIEYWDSDMPVEEDRKRNIQRAVANGG